MDFTALLQQAVKFEEEARAFYITAADVVKSEQAKVILRELAEEEAGHKAKLEDIIKRGASWAVPTGSFEQTVDLRIGEHVMPAALTAKSDFQDALLVAIKREEASHDFYASMANAVCAPQARQILTFLANEESKHKNKVQSIYDELVYRDF